MDRRHVITRRTFGLAAMLGVIYGATAPRPAEAQADQPTTHDHAPGAAAPSDAHASHDMSSMPAEWLGDEQIVFLGYQGMTALDLIGPQYMLGSLWGATSKIVAKTKDPLVTDTGVVILPDQTFDEAVREPDVICVPGGTTGTLAAMRDAETIAFVRSRGEAAQYVTSVCTGTLILGAAGLLEGYRASSHWITRPLLEHFGATAVDERVVIDRNRYTGAGVTAGIDFGLTMIAEMRDADYAKGMQLLAEYDPQPPFNAGTPQTAPAHLTQMLEEMFSGFRAEVSALVDK